MNTLLAAFLAAAAVQNLLPSVLSSFGLGTTAALEYVGYAVGTAGLWAYIGGAVPQWCPRAYYVGGQAVSAWAYFEAAQRAVCRLALPLDSPPKLPNGCNLCDVATGLPMSLVSLLGALFMVCLLQEPIK